MYEYLKEAPAGSNTATNPKYKRWHAVNEPLFDKLPYTASASEEHGCSQCPSCDIFVQYGKEEQCAFKYENFTQLADYLKHFKAKNGFQDENCCKKCARNMVSIKKGILCALRVKFRGKFKISL